MAMHPLSWLLRMQRSAPSCVLPHWIHFISLFLLFQWVLLLLLFENGIIGVSETHPPRSQTKGSIACWWDYWKVVRLSELGSSSRNRSPGVALDGVSYNHPLTLSLFAAMKWVSLIHYMLLALREASILYQILIQFCKWASTILLCKLMLHLSLQYMHKCVQLSQK